MKTAYAQSLKEQPTSKWQSLAEHALNVAQLAKSQLLDEPCKVPAWVLGGSTRRELLKTLAVGAGAAIPVVTSIVVPTVADAASGLPTGSGCTIDSQCASGICLSGLCN